jgi:hypothetical protein
VKPPQGWRVFHARRAALPARHGVAAGYDGDWHFAPDDAPIGLVWSDGHRTRRDAIAAAWREVSQAAWEAAPDVEGGAP